MATTLTVALALGHLAAAPLPPDVSGISLTNGLLQLEWHPYPATIEYRVYSGPAMEGPYSPVDGGNWDGFSWTGPALPGDRFYRIGAVTMAGDDLLVSTVLNRLAYGPTPDELERVSAQGPDAFIAEQLAPELIVEDLEIDRIESIGGWRRVVITGTATSSRLYLYRTRAGEVLIDDVRLVAGSDADQGPNLVRNGDFESLLNESDWLAWPNFADSTVTNGVAHSGAASLRLVATSSGSGFENSVQQELSPRLEVGAAYTVSYWYYAPANANSDLVVRLSLSDETTGLYAAADETISLRTRLEQGWATVASLRAWHIRHAIESPRQLVEVLAQFLENHFVTQYSKSRDYLDRYHSFAEAERRAVRMEWIENSRWREALLRPDCTFHELLTISAESPAMIIYLDTVSSRGDGRRVANENYARELFELFCLGVDNGYTQEDILEMSRVWTGWRIRLVDSDREFDPLAPQSTTLRPDATDTNIAVIDNLLGVWSFAYEASRHNPSNKVLFAGQIVPARFGPRYTERIYRVGGAPGVYQLPITGRSGSTGIEEGYEALAYLADLPFTQEYISVKLCRWFIHDEFEHGVYDYTDPELSAEGRLVRDCMTAWDNSIPRGQIRPLLQVIFNSDLFRGHDASLHKVKTPLEFTVSALRSLRIRLPDGSWSVRVDPAAVTGALGLMGGMSLFNREEPDGYPESAPGWISAGTLTERLRFVQALCIAPGQSGRADAGGCSVDPVAVFQSRRPEAEWNQAGALTDYLLGLLFPGEGVANLTELRGAAMHYLNTSEDGQSVALFDGLTPGTTAYDNRVRGVVAMLLSSPRFQEQ
jgi:uncharacterized protein (DUF1800 family)